MRAGVPDLTGRTLLAVFAHPDDESIACGGLLALCAQLGARVVLLCATRGDHGGGTLDEDVKAALRTLRTTELAAAADVLGIAEVHYLNYRDAYLQGTNWDLISADIEAVIVRERPDVVVTFAEDGLYWHPDHIVVHHATTDAVERLGTAGPALYYVTMPKGAIRTLVDTLRPRLPEGEASRVLGVTDADAFGVLAKPPTLVVDVGRVAARKLAALRCHRSQADGPLLVMRDDEAPALLGIEHYRRAAVGAAGEAFLDALAALG